MRAALKASHVVTDEQRAVIAILGVTCGIPQPDHGERDLWSYVLAQRPAEPWSLCGPDKTSLRIGDAAGLRENLTSLNALVDGVGHACRPPLQDHHTEKWLEAFLSLLAIEKMPSLREPRKSKQGKFKPGGRK